MNSRAEISCRIDGASSIGAQRQMNGRQAQADGQGDEAGGHLHILIVRDGQNDDQEGSRAQDLVEDQRYRAGKLC